MDVSKVEPCPGSHDLDRPERHNPSLATVESNEGGFDRRYHEEPSPGPVFANVTRPDSDARDRDLIT